MRNKFSKGYAAYFDGAPEEYNPYIYGTMEWETWNAGWNKAYEDESD